MQTVELVLIGLAWLVVYIGFCRVFPFASCRRCSGSGKRRSPSGKAFRNCGKCGGSGRRVRVFGTGRS
jgi:hypothetical protein